MKQTFEIPNGCTRVTIEQHEDKVLTIFETPIKESLPHNMTDYEHEMKKREINEQIEPEVMFEDGDILHYNSGNSIVIYKSKDRVSNIFHFRITNGKIDKRSGELFMTFEGSEDIRLATESEKQQLFDALAKVGKKWNAEKKCIEELKPERWRAEHCWRYWIVTDTFSVIEQDDIYCERNDIHYNIGNYFKTEQQARDFAERIKQLLR